MREQVFDKSLIEQLTPLCWIQASFVYDSHMREVFAYGMDSSRSGPGFAFFVSNWPKRSIRIWLGVQESLQPDSICLVYTLLQSACLEVSSSLTNILLEVVAKSNLS